MERPLTVEKLSISYCTDQPSVTGPCLHLSSPASARQIPFIVKACALSLLWLGAFEGVLHLKDISATSLGGHYVCGPWGCGPQLSVLLACHGFWFVLGGPLAILAVINLPRTWVRRLSLGLIIVAICGLLAVACWEAVTWLPQTSVGQRHYILQRYLFAVVTLIDMPILQSLTIGGGLWLAARQRSERPMSN